MSGTSSLKDIILAEVKRQQDHQVSIRRHLHQNPELSFEEHRTTEFLKKELANLGLKILPLDMPTGVLAELEGTGDGPVAAVRSDIDALPITEQTDLPFRSTTEGCMHACGHDVHMATVLGVATVLSCLREHVKGAVRFIFQPAEEFPPGGARPMIENGALDQVGAIFGLHVEPHMKTGRISVRDGVTMGSVTDFDLSVFGRTGHAARPHLAVDAITLAAEIVESLQKVVSREIDPISPAVITFGRIEGGTARNVIAGRVDLAGTARTLSPEAARQVTGLVKRTATNVAKAHGGRVEMNLVADYPVLVNDSRVNRLLARNYDMLFGAGKVDVTEPTLGGEDFACYLEKVPGAMFRLGVMNKKLKADKPWHSPEFMVDEAAIPFGTALLAAAVIDFLDTGLK